MACAERGSLLEGCFSASSEGWGLDQVFDEAAVPPCFITQILSPTLHEELRRAHLTLLTQTSPRSMQESYADTSEPRKDWLKSRARVLEGSRDLRDLHKQ